MAVVAPKVKSVVADKPMKAFQLIAVAVCILTNVTDGFDSSAMAYAGPGLIREWGLKADVLGAMLSANALGLVLGALVVAPAADTIGRRRVILGSLAMITVTMLLTPLAPSPAVLWVIRLLTGLGVGALVPSLAVMVSEYSNKKWGNVLLSCIWVGYAVGSTLVSMVAAETIHLGWRYIFYVAGAMNAVMLVAGLFLLPESLNFLLARQPRNALARINVLLGKLGENRLEVLPAAQTATEKKRASSIGAILSPAFLVTTLMLWLASFAHYFVSFFLTGLNPKVLADAGLTAKAALSIGTVTAPAAAIGVLLMGFLSSRIPVARLAAACFVLAIIGLVTFALSKADPTILYFAAGVSSFGIQAALTCVVITATHFYPPEVRGTGVGWTIGIGRLGAIFGPFFGGLMLSLDWDRRSLYPMFAVVAVVGAIAILIAAVTAARLQKGEGAAA
jgi:MFS family permease